MGSEFKRDLWHLESHGSCLSCSMPVQKGCYTKARGNKTYKWFLDTGLCDKPACTIFLCTTLYRVQSTGVDGLYPDF